MDILILDLKKKKRGKFLTSKSEASHPKGHPLFIPLLFLENKSRMLKEVGRSTEILPLLLNEGLDKFLE